MSTSLRLAALAVSTPLLILTPAACGGGGGGGGGVDGGSGSGDGGGPGSADAAPPAQCAGMNGGWVSDNASNTPDTISHDGELAITAGGTLMIAFAEPDSEQISDEDIWTTSNTGTGWSPSTALTSDSAVQNAYPSMMVDGETLHLVWNGYPGGINDVYYSSYGGSWSARKNLTKPYESDQNRHAYAPSLAMGPDGQMAIAYLSAPATDNGGIGITEVRVGLIQDGALTAAPVTVIPSTGAGCFDPTAVYGPDGTLHVAADCGQIFDEDIYYTRNSGGSWAAAAALPGNDGHDDASAHLLVAPDGSIHIVWTAREACNDTTCGHALYASQDAGGTWGQPFDASMKGTPGDYQAIGAIDQDGTVMLAYQRANSKNFFDVYVTTSGDGATFSAPCNITREPDIDDWMPHSLKFDPQTGKPHLTYVRILPDPDPQNIPLNTEVMHATLE